MHRKCAKTYWRMEPSTVKKWEPIIFTMYEEFKLFEDDPADIGQGYRAWYSSDDGKITYNLFYLTEGTEDIECTITHEWLHALFDWATVDDPNRIAFNVHDCTGDSDHYIMQQINFD